VNQASNHESLFQKFVRIFKPSRTIPITPWRAESTWSLGSGSHQLQRMFFLIFGLTLFGIGEAFLVVTGLGNSPWVVLSEGISLNSDFNIGESTFLVSVAVLAFWIPLKQMPGFGTVANIVVIAASLELGLFIIPEVSNLFAKYFMF